MTDVYDWEETARLHAEQGQGDPFAAAVRATRMSMIITDPRQSDNPIVFANAAFFALTGYSREEVLGRNCRFLQGPDTDPAAIDAIRDAIAARRDVAVDVLNYKKDGSPFWNGLYLSPVTSAEGDLHFFFGSQIDISDRMEVQARIRDQKETLEREVERRTEELQAALAAKSMLVHEVDHRVKNNLQMVSSLLAMQLRTIRDPDAKRSLAAMLQRIEAIGTVHRRLYQSTDVQRFDVGDFIRDIATDLLRASGRDDISLDVDLASVSVPAEQASSIALVLNELITNALKHAFRPDEPGRLEIRIARQDGRLVMSVADDGVGFEPTGNAGFGRRLINTIGRQLQAEVTWELGHPGTVVTLSMPFNRPDRECRNE